MRFTLAGQPRGIDGPSLRMVAAGVGVAALWAWTAFGGWGVRVFCGEFPTQSCLDQMSLFALASLLPAALAVTLMVLAFGLPVLRSRADLRAQALTYSLIAWLLAGGTLVLGGLPAI